MVPDIACECIRDVGYKQDTFHYATCEITNFLYEQSAYIAQGVIAERGDHSVGDQGIMLALPPKRQGL